MTRWGFDWAAGAKMKPNPLMRRPARPDVAAAPLAATRADAPVQAVRPREPKISAVTIPSGMESLAASWAGKGADRGGRGQ